MNIIEVKNNLVKFCYEEDLRLSGLVAIKDSQKKYLAQIMHLEATRMGKVAIAKILFNYADRLYTYDGSIPSLRADIQQVDTLFLLDTLDNSDPLVFGKISGQKDYLNVNFDFLHENPIILAEKFFFTKILLNNFALQLQARKKKLVVFDTAGVFKANKLTVTKDFRIPLNSSTINYIYEKGFEDATAESKALIQSIFEELGEYSKTVEFIPFDTFKAVVDAEFMRTKLIQLIVMKNKIKQIREWGVFAQKPEEFNVIRDKLLQDDTVVIDLSPLKPSLQQECIKYVYGILKLIGQEFYAFTPLASDGGDKFLLNQILSTENVHTSLICDYDYKYLSDLKKCSKNMVMFTPLKQQKDFGGYNMFLQKLAEDEFIAYGKITKFVPVIGKLTQLTPADIFVPKVEEVIREVAPPVPEPVVTPVVEEPVAEIPVAVEEPVAEIPVAVEEPAPEIQEPVPAEPVTEEVAEEISAESVASEPAEEQAEPQDGEEPVEAEEPAEVVEEDTPVEPAEQEAEAETEVPVAEEAEPETAGEEPAPAEEISEVQEALNEVEDVSEEDEALSDDDLDMIEQMSKPDEEIAVLNAGQEPVEEIPPVAEEIPADIQEATPDPESLNAVEEIPPAPIPPQQEPLQTRENTNPAIPEYKAEIPEEDRVNSDPLREGDRVVHEEFGEGVVEKMISYGDKILCSVNFASVGRRLLNPEISEMKRI